MTEKYLDGVAARALRENMDQFFENPPADYDPVLAELDRGIVKSEGIPTWYTINTLTIAQTEDKQRETIPVSQVRHLENEQAMVDLDEVLKGSYEAGRGGILSEEQTPADVVFEQTRNRFLEDELTRDAQRRRSSRAMANAFNNRGRRG